MTSLGATEFLYPFLAEPSTGDPTALMSDLVRSAEAKWAESKALGSSCVAANSSALADAAALLRAAPQVLLAGNGGSSCDADRVARLLRDRVASSAGGLAIRVRSLVADPATLTALGNDLGIEQIFSRQVEAYGRTGDVLVVFSTSGASANLMKACDTAHRRGLHTVAVAGYGGGSLVDNRAVDCCLVVDSVSVHRIQEAQADLIDALVASV